MDARSHGAAMKERWFADDRDLVKWSALLHFARRHKLARILQVAYLRDDERPRVTIGDEDVAVDNAVWSFFRDVHRVHELGVATGIRIDVIADRFEPTQRGPYVDSVVATIRAAAADSMLLFLDPDTGLEPGRLGTVHVARDEVRRYWAVLRSGDWLSIYQHARHDTTWHADVPRELSALCGDATTKVARSADIGKDVMLLFVEKP